MWTKGLGLPGMNGALCSLGSNVGGVFDARSL